MRTASYKLNVRPPGKALPPAPPRLRLPSARLLTATPGTCAAGYALLAALLAFGTGSLLHGGRTTDIIGGTDDRAAMVLRLSVLIAVSAVLVWAALARAARAQRRIERIADAVPGLCALIDPAGSVDYANDSFRRTLGGGGASPTGRPLDQVIDPHRLPVYTSMPLLPRQGETEIDILLAGHDGTPRTSGVRIRPLDERDRRLGWILTGFDDVETQDLRFDNMLKSQALDTATDGVVIADVRMSDWPVIYVNRAFTDITGYSAEEVLGRNMRFLQGNDRQQPEIALLRGRVAKRQPVTATLRNYRRDGTLFWNRIRLAPAAAADGSVSHYVGVISDVTRLIESEGRVAELTDFDPQTHLANRAAFVASLGGLLDRMAGVMVVVTLDVIRFADIMGGLRADESDRLVRAIADRLRALPGAALAGRLAENAFAVAIECPAEDAAGPAVAAVRNCLAQPFALPDGEEELQFYAGVAIGLPRTSAATLVHQALIALGQSRQNSAGEASFGQTCLGATHAFDPSAADELRRRLGLSRDLQLAIGNGDFALHLQPMVALDSGVWVGAEALVRWRHPIYGVQHPGLFLPLSEQTGQIQRIDAWTLRSGAELARRLNLDAAATPICINVSLARLRHRDFVAELAGILRDTGADPTTVRIEIAERGLAGGAQDVIDRLMQIRALGVGIVIDDFGTGPSSLLVLHKLPVSEIKIDRSFIRDCETQPHHRAVIEAFVGIAGPLGIAVTATGVENEAQRRMLQRLGVRRAQGYLFSPPIDADAFAARLPALAAQSFSPGAVASRL